MVHLHDAVPLDRNASGEDEGMLVHNAGSRSVPWCLARSQNAQVDGRMLPKVGGLVVGIELKN